MKFVFDMIAETKERFENMINCSKAKKDIPLLNFVYFFWCSYEPFTIISTILIFVVLLAISFGIEFYIFSSVALSLLFLAFSIWSHKEMGKKAKERMDAFESIIKASSQKNAVGDSTDFKVFIVTVDEKRCTAYPVFSMKKNLISHRKLDFIFVTNDSVKVCTGATPFDLLNPIKKNCADAKDGAKCGKSVAIKDIKSMTFAEGGVQITKTDDSTEVIYKCSDKTASDVMKAYQDNKKAMEDKAAAKKKEDDAAEAAKKKAEEEAKANSDLEAFKRVVQIIKNVGKDMVKEAVEEAKKD
ncbi:MAG: hypothetical protein IE881_07005 [Epsilonproteobacteria bacterium]|nr:hypothetical protein [Campylobacterota bacterium]